jgi:hypothetical protein
LVRFSVLVLAVLLLPLPVLVSWLGFLLILAWVLVVVVAVAAAVVLLRLLQGLVLVHGALVGVVVHLVQQRLLLGVPEVLGVLGHQG